MSDQTPVKQLWFRRDQSGRILEPLVSYHASVLDLIDFVRDHLEPDTNGSTLEMFGDPKPLPVPLSPVIQAKLSMPQAFIEHGFIKHDMAA